MKSFSPIIFPFIVMGLFLFSDCGNRDSLLENAKINKADIPVVLTVDPSSDRADIPSNTVLSVRFSVSMDTASVENAFTYTIDDAASSTGGVFEWFDNNRMFIYDPGTGGFPTGSLITATIDVSAESVSGIHLSEPYEWSFTPGTDFYSGNPSILNSIPSALQVVQVSDLGIVIEFNRFMLRTTVESSFLLVSDDNPDEGPRSADNGSFTWESTTNGERFTYVPDEELVNANTYTLYLNNGGILCRDLAGNTLPSFQMTFYTADTAIYVSNDYGSDANEGFHKNVPVLTIDKAIVRAQAYDISLIKIEGEGQGPPGPDYSGPLTIPGGLTIEGGWSMYFDTRDPSSYETVIDSGAGAQYTLFVSGVSDVTLDGLTVYGGTATGSEDSSIFIDNSSNVTVKNCNILGPNTTLATRGDGIRIENSSDITIKDNDGISGGAAPANTGIYILGTSQNVTIKNNKNIMGITGGATGESAGIKLGDGTGPVVIEGNDPVSGAFTSNNPTYGIYVSSNATATIRNNTHIYGGITLTSPTYGIFVDSGADVEISDNDDINGGATSDGDTYGIYIGNSTDARIFRNQIIGGTSNPSPSGRTDYGVYIDQANECILFNNFIRGSTDSSYMDNDIYGVYSEDTGITAINNTIGPGGQNPGNANSYVICFRNDSSPAWSIDPVLINNVFLDSYNNFNDAIRIIHNQNPASDPIELTVFNNTFRTDNFDHLIDGNFGFDLDDISSVNNETLRLTPQPENNDEFSSGDISFNDSLTADFHISATSPDTSSIEDNGYTNLSTLPIFTADPSLLDELLEDIDGTTRDPASIDRGAHEFNP